MYARFELCQTIQDRNNNYTGSPTNLLDLSELVLLLINFQITQVNQPVWGAGMGATKKC